MHPETFSHLEVTQSIADAAMCYYQISVDEESIDTQNNSYEWQVTFTSLINVNPTLLYAESLLNMEADNSL